MRDYFEQGPIRPPSEATSLLIRVTRNCPWNKCAFCHTYKNSKFSLRKTDEVKEEIQLMKDIADEVRALSWRLGFAGKVTKEVVEYIYSLPDSYGEGFRIIAVWLYFGGKSVFLQDANTIMVKNRDLVDILKTIKEKFPQVERITSYGRSSTIAKRKSVEDLKELYLAGLTRLHVGMESGYDFLLKYVKKGATAKDHIEAGIKVKKSEIELSEYYILGLGGKKWWRQHAIESAKVLNQINPDFIRIRTLKLLPIMPLYKKVEEGDFLLQSEEEMIIEERLLIEKLEGINSYFLSDHILNLLGELEGRLPQDKERMLAIIDRFLSLPKEEKLNYMLGRRATIYETMDDMKDPELYSQVNQLISQIESEKSGSVEETISRLKENFL